MSILRRLHSSRQLPVLSRITHHAWGEVVPLTSKTERIYPSEAMVAFQGEERKAMADQLATISKARLFRRADILSQEDMRRIEQAIRVQLDIH